MKLDIIIATYNRSSVLPNALASLCEATPADDLDLTITVVDNNSTDNTQETVEKFKVECPVKIRYLRETKQGKSRALNKGIRESQADLIGFIDDDITVPQNWVVEVSRVFGKRWDEVDFLGGRVLPLWQGEIPAWLPQNVSGVLALQDHGNHEHKYGSSFEGQLPGCQAIIKRSALTEVGPYNEQLGPCGKDLLGSEDDEMFYRLLDAGKRGIYSPSLFCYHLIPSYRLTKPYFREWSYNWGRAQALIDSNRSEYAGPRILGVPRYLYGNAFRGACRMPAALLMRNAADYFSSELNIWILAGFISQRDDARITRLMRSFLNKLNGTEVSR
jgi:glucosyl-dolichyl phosphate glucuronosyltransferase